MLFLTVYSDVILAVDKSTHGDQTLHETLCDVGLKFWDQVKSVMDQYKGLAQANKQLKEAGASYQKSLTADTKNLSRYITDEQLTGMAGIYNFDAAYSPEMLPHLAEAVGKSFGIEYSILGDMLALYWNLLTHLLGFGNWVRNLYQKAFKRS